jgi:ubiquinone/menaquinone biosynthesis C-methylase UbiE
MVTGLLKTATKMLRRSPTPPGADPNRKEVWDKLARPDFQRDFAQVAWGGLARVGENHNLMLTGRPDQYWVHWFRDKYLPSAHGGRVLSLGCGEGRIERLFKEHGCTFDSVTGYDVSEACVDVANRLGRETGLAPEVDYRVADVNAVALPAAAFDFVLFFHALHHITALEHVLQECAKALTPGGVMLVNEFVGPSRFQWSDLQMRLANQILHTLPPDLRVDLTHGGHKETVARNTVEQMIAMDPTEAVRSAEIERLLYEMFRVVEDRPWGGTILNLLFEDIAGNFAPDNPLHDTIVRLVVQHENALIEKGVIPSDFKVYVCRRR